MNIRDALIHMAPSLELQRAAAAEIAKLDHKVGMIERLREAAGPCRGVEIQAACLGNGAIYADECRDCVRFSPHHPAPRFSPAFHTPGQGCRHKA